MKNYPRHYGDDLCSKDKRLNFVWRWYRVASLISKEQIKKWTHFQCSVAKVDKKWKLETIQWGSEDNITYEATISYNNNRLESKTGFKTRIDAQIGAEKLLQTWIKDQVKLIEAMK